MNAVSSVWFSALLTVVIAGAPVAARSALDANGDGRYSFNELRTVYPTLSAATFDRMDVNSDGWVTPGEFRAGQDAGLLPAAKGG